MLKISKLGIGGVIALLVCLSFAFALDKPVQREDPFVTKTSLLSATSSPEENLAFDISPSPFSIMGSACSNLYTTTAEYCSGQVRIYYQCLQTSSGREWQQRSENCADYSGRCVVSGGKAECVDGWGQTSYGKKLLFMSFGLLILACGIIALSIMGILPIWINLFSLLILYQAIKLFIQFIAGGV